MTVVRAASYDVVTKFHCNELRVVMVYIFISCTICAHDIIIFILVKSSSTINNRKGK